MIAIILGLGLPIIAVIMVFVQSMKKNRLDKEVRQLIIENHIDPETAKLLIDEPKKAPKPGTIDVGNLRFACMLLGVGLGAGIDWLADVSTKSIYFWLIVAFGVGIGMLCSFLVELRLAKKQHPTEDNWKAE
jgi:hypothetical protein